MRGFLYKLDPSKVSCSKMPPMISTLYAIFVCGLWTTATSILGVLLAVFPDHYLQ